MGGEKEAHDTGKTLGEISMVDGEPRLRRISGILVDYLEG